MDDTPVSLDEIRAEMPTEGRLYLEVALLTLAVKRQAARIAELENGQTAAGG